MSASPFYGTPQERRQRDVDAYWAAVDAREYASRFDEWHPPLPPKPAIPPMTREQLAKIYDQMLDDQNRAYWARQGLKP